MLVQKKIVENTYSDELYSSNLDGYIQILQLQNGKVVNIKNVRGIGEVREVISSYANQVDTYITPNTFYIPFRNSSNIRQLRSLYVDLDDKEVSPISKLDGNFKKIFKHF